MAGGTIDEDASTNDEPPKKKPLTDAQLKRIERNKNKAIQLRKARIAHGAKAQNAMCQKKVNISSQPRETGGGFFLEDDPDAGPSVEDRPVVNVPAPLFSEDRPTCEECKKEFVDSFLQQNFDFMVCDNCRDNDDKHCLISKTDAKKEYMLKDCDLDKREPPLRFIERKNPHNLFTQMKLYLRLQVEKRAFEVYGSEEGLEEKKEERIEAQEKRKQRAFDKKIKALRMTVRSSLFRKTERGHDHSYGPESYNEEEDTYQKTCTICDYTLTYEKM